MSLLRHRLNTAYRLIEENRIEPNELGWLSKRWSGNTYQVIYSWRLFVQHKDGWGCNCPDRRITGVECADIRAVKIYIEQHKAIKA